ncbi:uncharacterized protein LOC110870248 [Helianthus annuus]|uniref:uncharacterized protein LOC110870248 n=1 Tax=Helianthus annuus TaxID=4232 RepID=UPI000B8FAD8B|nr:uncharacterized protein LOC110870248 [Helianthus annuus]
MDVSVSFRCDWAGTGLKRFIDPGLVRETTDMIVQIRDRIESARDRQKSYADKRQKPLEFEVDNMVLLKVSPWKGVVRIGKCGKLDPRYIGPFEILERIETVAHKLKLSEELSSVHDTFHVSNLKKLQETVVIPAGKIHVNGKPQFTEKPVEVTDWKVHKNRKSHT